MTCISICASFCSNTYFANFNDKELLDFPKKKLVLFIVLHLKGMTRSDYMDLQAFLWRKCDFLPDFQEIYTNRPYDTPEVLRGMVKKGSKIVGGLAFFGCFQPRWLELVYF